MGKTIFMSNQSMLFLSGVVIFVLLLVITHKILKQMSIFRGTKTVIVAICVSLLSIIGLSRLFVITNANFSTTPNRCDITLDVIFLPYTALALTVILVLILLFINRTFRNHKMDRTYREILQRKTQND